MNVITLKYPESQTKNWIPLDLDQVFNIVLHHPQAVIASPDDINNWHLANGWNGAGYNEYIRKDGTVYLMRGDHIGAQSQGNNSTSYGICCEGDYSKELLMPETQKKSLMERIRFHKNRFLNYKATLPHWQLNDTECPGKYFPMVEILQKLERVEVKKMEPDNKLIDPIYQNCVDLVAKTIGLNSKTYWEQHSDINVHRLIELMANYIYTQTDV